MCVIMCIYLSRRMVFNRLFNGVHEFLIKLPCFIQASQMHSVNMIICFKMSRMFLIVEMCQLNTKNSLPPNYGNLKDMFPSFPPLDIFIKQRAHPFLQHPRAEPAGSWENVEMASGSLFGWWFYRNMHRIYAYLYIYILQIQIIV